ncbi:low affinity iron permease family protein [soil metagenome]
MSGNKNKLFTRFAKWTSKVTGKPITFLLAIGVVVVWALTGPIFNYNETWQLVINTGTTIITFLMIFLIQNTQNRDTEALQLKLDEIIRSMDQTRNQVLDLEELDEEELDEIREEYLGLAKKAKEEEAEREAEEEKQS